MEAPASPTMEFRGMDDSATFEFFDGSSAIQNRKRRRSSLRRVSFAEQPSIHVFARDDDYETPPEGTMSRLSTQSTPSSISRSPQRRSERLSAAREGRQNANEVDKENVQTSPGKNSRQMRRGRRPLALRDTAKEEDQEEFLKPSNWLDDRENSAFGSCDENSGPVDLHHITMCDQIVAVEDDDNMTMDSQTFHTRMSQMLSNQPLHRLSEGRETATTTPRNYTDMDLTALWPEKKAQVVERKLLDQPTWHKGDGDISDMTQGSVEVLLRVLAKKKPSRMESSIHDTEENTMEGWDNWTEGDAQSQGRILSMRIERSVSRSGVDDTVSMETSSPISDRDRRKLFVAEEEEVANSKNGRDADGLHVSQLQGRRTSEDTELHSESPALKSENRISKLDNDENVSVENTSQSLAGRCDSDMEILSGTVEGLIDQDMHTSSTVKKCTSTKPECKALESRFDEAAEPNFIPVDDNIGSHPTVQSAAGTGEDSPVPLRHYERSRKRVSTSAAENNKSVSIQRKMDSSIHYSISQGHAQPMSAEPVAGQQVVEYGPNLERQDSFLEHRILNNEWKKSQTVDTSVHVVTKSGTSFPAPCEDTDSMDITRTWTEHAPRLTSVPTKSSDSPKSFLWEGREQCMDMFDGDITDRYQEGITEAMPKLTFVLGRYDCDSPSGEPLNRIFERKSDIDAEDSAVYVAPAENDIQQERTFKSVDDYTHNRAAEEKESVSNQCLDDDTTEMQSGIGKIRNMFQNPEDTFSFKGHQKSSRDASLSKSMGQNLMPRSAFPTVQGKVDAVEANLKNQSELQSSAPDVQDEDTAAVFTDEHNWRAEVSSDMSTTPLSPRRSKHFQRLVLKAQTVSMQIDTPLTDSPSFQDDISAAIPNVQDPLAADAETPESGLGWNPRKIVWSAQQSSLHDLGGEVVLRQPTVGQMEDEATHSPIDKLCTPRDPKEKKPVFECMSEEAAKTLNQVSHSKEVRNSVASKMLLRMMSLPDNGCAQEESYSDAETRQILGRTLHFQPENDSQLQSLSLRGDAEQQTSARNPDVTVEVGSLKNVDKDMDSNGPRVESLEEESRTQKQRQEMQVAEERLVALERRSDELRKRAEDCHQAIAKKCRNNVCFEMKEMAVFFSQAPFCKLQKRFQLLNCMQSWDLKTTKSGGDEVLHKFEYWALFTHSVFERMDNNLEFSVSKSSIDLNEASINQVYRHMNASLAWRWFLSGHEETRQPQSLFHHIQGVHSKVMILLDLMEEVNSCRKYLVVPHFGLQIGSDLRLNIQFSDSRLLFDFVVSFDMKQVTHMSFNSHELDNATEMNQTLDCTVQIESAGRFFGKKISEADIKRSVVSVVPGHLLLLRVCASIDTLILSMKE